MKRNKSANYLLMMGCLGLGLSFTACSDDEPAADTSGDDYKYVGQAIGNFSADEWYPGGKLGTTDNISSGCYEGLHDTFKH